MPTDFLTFDTDFPDGAKKLDSVIDYLEQLRESLRYTLYNLSMENLNDAALGELAEYINAPVYVKVEDVAGAVTALSLTVDGVAASVTDVEGNVSALSLTVSGLSSTVSTKVGNDEIISKINQSAEEVSISATKLTLEGIITANNNFKILNDGSMEAVNGKFSGEINANSGTFGGKIYFGSNSTANYIDGNPAASSSPVMNFSNKFMVSAAGQVRADGMYFGTSDDINTYGGLYVKNGYFTLESIYGIEIVSPLTAAIGALASDGTSYNAMAISGSGVNVSGYGAVIRLYSTATSTSFNSGWEFTASHIYLNGVQML